MKPFRSLSHAVDQIQTILDADLAARRSGWPLAKALAHAVSGIPVDPGTGAKAAVLVDDAARSAAIKKAVVEAGVDVVDVAKLPAAGRIALLASRVEDLQAFARGKSGAALVLVDSGASFSDIVALIGSGGGAIVDPSLVPSVANGS